MRNRAKCKLCQSTIESFHPTDLVLCKCGEISVDAGEGLKCAAKSWENFLRVDDEGNEIIVKVESKTNPNNIYTEVMKLRPGLRPHAISQYHNLTVCWQITFKGYDSMEPPSTVYGRYLNGAMQVILNVDSLPHELIIAEEDTLFWVTGKIKAINIYGVIELSEATILKVG